MEKLILFMPQQEDLLVARTGKHQRGPSWDHPDKAFPSFPRDRSSSPCSQLDGSAFWVPSACAGELDRKFQRRQAPQHPPGGLGGRAIPSMAVPHSSGVCPRGSQGLPGIWAALECGRRRGKAAGYTWHKLFLDH